MTTTVTAFDRLTGALRDHGSLVTVNGDKATAQCPAHDDGHASLSVGPRGDHNGAVLYCHAGCQTDDVIAALNLSMPDLFDEPRMRAAYSDRNTYSYSDGRKVHRSRGANGRKAFKQSGNTKGNKLFHVELVAAAPTVYVPEGEKDVLAIESIGGVAVCPAMGAGKAHKFDWSPLAGKHIIPVADRDDAGRTHAREVAGLVSAIAVSVTIVEPATGKDAADHIAAGHTLDELVPVDVSAEDDPPAVTRDGSRAWVDTPFDSPYAHRLRKFGVHWDSDSARWWVGIAKANALEGLLKRPLGDAIDEQQPQTEAQRPAAAELVDMAVADYILGVGDDAQPYGSYPDVPHVALPLRGGKLGLRNALARAYFRKHDTVPASQALADACNVIEALAAEAEPRTLHLRVASRAGRIYIDMADNADRVIEIAHGSWRITTSAPVVFRRSEVTAAMPEPLRGGDINKLWDHINIVEEDRPILLAVLIAALVQPDVSHVILALLAGHGCAKTTTAKRIVALTDPSAAPTSMPPRDTEGWVHTANGSWVVAIDNVSKVPEWWSNALCRAATGDAMTKRRLWTNADLAVLKFRRQVILTGIDLGGLAEDLTDRLALVELNRIDEDGRAAETDLDTAWERDYPAILGALLDLAAQTHQLLPAVTVARLPRMADFGLVLACIDHLLPPKGGSDQQQAGQAKTSDPPENTASTSGGGLGGSGGSGNAGLSGSRHMAGQAGQNPSFSICKGSKELEALGSGEGLKRYRERTSRLAADSLESDSFISELMARRYSCTDLTAREIRAAISLDEDNRRPADWPKNARAVTTLLTLHAPGLRSQGWVVEHDDGLNKTSVRQWTISPPGGPEEAGNPDPPNPPNPPKADNSRSDGRRDGGLDGNPDPPNPPNPPSNPPPNPPNPPPASHASQKCTPSLVLCKNCGDEIPAHWPLARASGYCSKSTCIAAANT